jgi:putative ABC transport system permease protein
MARRDVRRHRGRSLLIAIMVGLPVLLLVAGSTLWYSEDLDTAERLPLQLGQSQGWLIGPQPEALQQLLSPNMGYSLEGDQPKQALPVPGYGPGQETAALGELVGGTLHEVSNSWGSARVGRHWVNLGMLGADPREAPALYAPRIRLESGRWPTSADEVVVTPLGIDAGLPTSGTFELQEMTPDKPTSRTVTVVGTGQGFSGWGAERVEPVDLITLPAGVTGTADRTWLIERNTPITWPEIERLNTYGVGVYSRYVAEHPETMTLRGEFPSGATSPLYVVGGASLGLLLLTTLLAGPAFAVSAARQRHTLALAASNGATRAQLRRSVLAQALVLGVLSAGVGAVAGLVGGLVGARIIGGLAPRHFFGPAQVPWAAIGLVAAAGVISSVVAALIPSRGLGRLDIVSVMRGQSVSPRLRKRVPVVGAALVAVGVGAVLLASFRSDDKYFFVFLGGVLLIVIGALLIVPRVLAVGGRIAHRLPLPARMAAREAGRLRGRATPTVAAIMAGAAVLATVCIGMQADTVRQARNYQPQTLPGQAIVFGGGGPNQPADDAVETIRATLPGAKVLTTAWLSSGSGDTAAVKLAAVVPGCSPAETIPDLALADANGGYTVRGDELPRCAAISSDGVFPGTNIVVVRGDNFADFMGLDATQQEALTAGAVAILDPAVTQILPAQKTYVGRGAIEQMRPQELDAPDGQARFYRYTSKVTQSTPEVTAGADGSDLVTLPVVTLNHAQWLRAVIGYSGGYGALMTEETARRLGLDAIPDGRVLVRGDRPITEAQEGQLVDALRSRDAAASVTVERGFERSDALIIAIVIGVIALIILVATLIATALGQAEAAPLLGTLAAVGATRRTRRLLAGAQATYLALLGAVLGVLVGIAPGIAISRIITASFTEHGPDLSTVVIDIPWLQILLPIVLIPLVAGALAFVSIRQAPTVTRRAT